MVAGASSLPVVRNELFATMEQIRLDVQNFAEQRTDKTSLQAAVDSLQQLKGIMTLLSLPGAELLAHEMHSLCADFFALSEPLHKEALASLSTGLQVLRGYLEQLEANWIEMPELLLPAINQLRELQGNPSLPESHFFCARLNGLRPNPPAPVAVDNPQALLARLQRLLQQALLSVVRDQQGAEVLPLLQRILAQMDAIDAHAAETQLYWVGQAMLESMCDAKLALTQERKLLLCRLEREIKQFQTNPEQPPAQAVIKAMLYLVALANSSGPLATELRTAANLLPLPFTDPMLREGYQRLSGPSANLIQSLVTSIKEELAALKDSLEQLSQQPLEAEVLANLLELLAKLEKTLQMVGLGSAGLALQRQLALVQGWVVGALVNPAQLLQLADTLIYIEGLIASMNMGQQHAAQVSQLSEEEVFAQQQLAEAYIVIRDEAHNALALAKSSVSHYLDSGGDKTSLAGLNPSLVAARGGLYFSQEQRAAELLQQCGDYIAEQLLASAAVPDKPSVEALAEALTGLEYYLEQGGQQSQGDGLLLDAVAHQLTTVVS